jgi:type II secretory pathway component PulK
MTRAPRRASSRRGFALITVIWVMTVAAVVALAAELAGRDAYDAGRNRVFADRAYWRAADCMARTHALIDAVLGTTSDAWQLANLWRTLDVHIRGDGILAISDCTIHLEAAGTRLDINSAPDTLLLGVFAEAGFAEQAAAMLDAFRDWTDSDSVARPLGAEADWYVAAGRPGPRNGPIADIRELAFIRGFETAVPVLKPLLTTEPGRLSLANASLDVLAAVPGFTPEALSRLSQMRETDEPIADLAAFASSLSPDGMNQMAAHFDQISRTVTVDPDAWIVTAVGTAGRPAVTTTLEYRFVRSGNRAVATRRKVDP